MSDSDGKKTLGLRGSRPGSVKQSFSHGRTKNVVVETKRKRVVVPKPGATTKSPSVAAGKVTQRYQVGPKPMGIAVAARRNLLVAADYGWNAVFIVD